MAIAYIPHMKYFFVLEKSGKKNETEKRDLKGQISRRKNRFRNQILISTVFISHKSMR